MNTEPTPPFATIKLRSNLLMRVAIGILNLFKDLGKQIRMRTNTYFMIITLGFWQAVHLFIVAPIYGVFIKNIGPREVYSVGWLYLPLCGIGIVMTISAITSLGRAIKVRMPKE